MNRTESEGKHGPTFVWRIENFSHCVQEMNEWLSSPVFIVDALSETDWTLRLYPKGRGTEDCLGLSLVRGQCGPELITVDFELSLLSVDESSSVHKKYPLISFLKDYDWCDAKCREPESLRSEIISRKSQLISNDTLTVRCQLGKPNLKFSNFESESNVGESMHAFARTLVGIDRLSIDTNLKSFSASPLDTSWRVPLRSASTHRSMDIILKLSGSALEESRLCIDVDLGAEQSYTLMGEISVLDAIGEKKRTQQVQFSKVNGRRCDALNFIRRAELIGVKNQYLNNDSLFLRCEFKMSTGVIYSKVEKTHTGTLALFENCTGCRHLLPGKDNSDGPLPSPHANKNCGPVQTVLQQDMRRLYEDRALSDVEIRSGGASFRAHRSVLGARSPVFRSMFESDMAESSSGLVNVPDVDANTLDAMLLYFYSDVIGDMDCDLAAELLYVADKYQVPSLKQKCCSYLEFSLSVSNVCKALVLAHRHNEDTLLSSVHDFIVSSDTAVMCSQEWAKFVNDEAHLAAKTMHLVYKRKLNV